MAVVSPELIAPATTLSSARVGRAMPVWLTKTYLVAADVAAIAIAMALAFNFRTALPGNSPIGAQGQHIKLAAITLPVWIGLFAYYRLYTARFLTTRLEEMRRLIHAIGAGV